MEQQKLQSLLSIEENSGSVKASSGSIKETSASIESGGLRGQERRACASNHFNDDLGRMSVELQVEQAVRTSLKVLSLLSRVPKSPWRNTCLYRSIAQCLVYRKFNIPARICLGVRKSQLSNDVSAHAWVEVDGQGNVDLQSDTSSHDVISHANSKDRDEARSLQYVLLTKLNSRKNSLEDTNRNSHFQNSTVLLKEDQPNPVLSDGYRRG